MGIGENAYYCFHKTVNEKGFCTYCGTDCNPIAKLPETPQTVVWVSVDDSMPPIGADCVVRTTSRYLPLDIQECYNNGDNRPTWRPGWRKGDQYEITHWMIVKPPTST